MKTKNVILSALATAAFLVGVGAYTKYSEEADVKAIRHSIAELKSNRQKGYSETETASYVEDDIRNFKKYEPIFIGNSVISNLEKELTMARATKSTNVVYTPEWDKIVERTASYHQHRK